MNYSPTHAPYEHHTSPTKQICRALLFEEVLRVFPDRGAALRVCTLSNTCYILERQLLREYPNTKLFLVEHQKSVFNQMSVQWAGTNIKVLYGDLLNILKFSPQFDVIWADMCSPITCDLLDTFSFTLNYNKPAIFACTIMATREQNSVLPKSGVNSKAELREDFPKLISKGSGYELIQQLSYHSNTGHVHNPFRFYIFSNH